MRCPFCQSDNDRVVDSRTSEEGGAIRRRRVCNHCKRRFTTYERVEEATLKVVKSGKHREPFNREKIERGLMRACWKRPISDEQIKQIASKVEQVVYHQFDGEVPSDAIGEIVMQQLAAVDQVAYVRFASVYRRFDEVGDFVATLNQISGRLQDVADKPL